MTLVPAIAMRMLAKRSYASEPDAVTATLNAIEMVDCSIWPAQREDPRQRQALTTPRSTPEDLSMRWGNGVGRGVDPCCTTPPHRRPDRYNVLVGL